VKKQSENALLVVLLGLATATALAWLHSHLAGYQRTWSDSRRQLCGRFASVRGLLLWQQCNLAQYPPLPSPMSNWPVVVPGDFVVGTNPAGERTIVPCGSLAVPFAFPERGTFIRIENRTAASTDGSKNTRWCARWTEIALAYWIILVLLLLAPAEVAVRRLLMRIRSEREHEGEPIEPSSPATPH
jgi:hypothetical protein